MKELTIRQVRQLAECKDKGEYKALLKHFIDVTPEAARFYNEAHSKLQEIWLKWHTNGRKEDLKAYWQSLQPVAAQCGVQIDELNGHPFTCSFSVGDRQFKLTMTEKTYSYRRIR